jgi:hypothetical protein
VRPNWVATIHGLGDVTFPDLTWPPSSPVYDPSTGVMTLPTGQQISVGSPSPTPSTVPQQTIPSPTWQVVGNGQAWLRDTPPPRMPGDPCPTYGIASEFCTPPLDWGKIAIVGAGVLLLLGLLARPR